MKCVRTIEYEAEDPEDIKRHLENTLLSAQIVIRPGDYVPGIGPIFGKKRGPQVTIRLLSETWDTWQT